LLIRGSPFQGRYPASEVNDGACPGKPDHLTGRQSSGSSEWLTTAPTKQSKQVNSLSMQLEQRSHK